MPEGIGAVSDPGNGGSLVAMAEHLDDGPDDKSARNPRWTKHETSVLVAAKKKQEEDACRLTGEERWEYVYVLLKSSGVDRDARQCRKRWSNLFGEYKKIRDWQRLNSLESYWVMRSDKRRDQKLPGAFDEEVFAEMDAFLGRKPSDSPDAALDHALHTTEDGLFSEVEQDHDDHDIADLGQGDGSSSPPSALAEQEGDDKGARNPRWTKHESRVLVAAKRKREEELKMLGPNKKKLVTADEKWESVSTYCKASGVDRDAKQCRKRWSNLWDDYKKIRDWRKRSGVDSYWVMKSKKRRENKLPGKYDAEVFADIDGMLGGKPSMVPVSLFDSSRPSIHGARLLPELEQDHDDHDVPDMAQLDGAFTSHSSGREDQKAFLSGGRKKRNRAFRDADDDTYKEQLVLALESSGKVMQAALAHSIQVQTDAHNHNAQLDRAQRKEQADSLVGVLQKLADALSKIADRI